MSSRMKRDSAGWRKILIPAWEIWNVPYKKWNPVNASYSSDGYFKEDDRHGNANFTVDHRYCDDLRRYQRKDFCDTTTENYMDNKGCHKNSHNRFDWRRVSCFFHIAH